MIGFHCHVCGRYHEGVPMSFGFDVHPSLLPPPEEWEGRVVMNDEMCVIDDETFLVRGCLEIPVADGAEPFVWNVWVSLSRENFDRTSALWTTEGREREPPYFGWLMTGIPGYPRTTLLTTNVHTRPVGLRPLIELEPTDHPLAVEQRMGITMARAQEIAEAMLHPPGETDASNNT